MKIKDKIYLFHLRLVSFILIIFIPTLGFCISEQDYYIDQSIFNAGNQCITELDSRKPSQEELKKLAFGLLDLRDSSGISADVSMRAMSEGVSQLKSRYSCSQILELYQRLYLKYGLTGNFIE